MCSVFITVACSEFYPFYKCKMHFFIPLQSVLGALDDTKCPKVDAVPNVVYKFSDTQLYKLLANFYTGLLIHSYVPNSRSVIEITPILKNAFNDPTTSSNYRSISISSTGSKILEKNYC